MNNFLVANTFSKISTSENVDTLFIFYTYVWVHMNLYTHSCGHQRTLGVRPEIPSTSFMTESLKAQVSYGPGDQQT